MPRKGTTTPVVEGPAHKGPLPTSEQALKSRLRQQEILAALGVTALKGTPFEQLLEEAVHLSTEGLHAEFGKVLEFIPSEDRFVMRAGSGWDKELVGKATVGADLESPAGYALRTGKPVISNHLEREQRFRTPGLLAAHGVRARSTSSCKETVGPMAFLKWIASLVANSASTISRSCKAPLISWEWQSSDNDASVLTLVKEINHRVKNSLQLVASVLRLQMQDDPQVMQRDRLLAVFFVWHLPPARGRAHALAVLEGWDSAPSYPRAC